MDGTALALQLAPSRERFLRFAERRLGNPADAEDVLQRAWLRATAAAESIENPDRATAWFFRLLRRTILDHQRSARPATVELDPNAPPMLSKEFDGCPCVEPLLDELRPGYAALLRGIDKDGASSDGVAAALGLTTGNVHVRLHRARAALRRSVEERCGVTSIRPCLACTCDTGHRCCDSPR